MCEKQLEECEEEIFKACLVIFSKDKEIERLKSRIKELENKNETKMKIEISKKSFNILENLAVERNEKPEKVLKNLIKQNENGIPFDAEKHSIDNCINVAIDTVLYIYRKHKELSEKMIVTKDDLEMMDRFEEFWDEMPPSLLCKDEKKDV